MRPLIFILSSCLSATACQDFIGSEFPRSAVAFSPPAHFRLWWKVVEACSGRRASFDAVEWYKVSVFDGLTLRGDHAAGVWFANGNRIVISDAWIGQGSLVRHEMLHAILGSGAHNPDIFGGTCTDEVVCGRDCGDQTPLPGAVEIPVGLLEVKADFYPVAPSISEHGRRAVVVVHVRNPTIDNVFVSAGRFSEAQCAVGFRIAAAGRDRVVQGCRYLGYNPADARVYLKRGENRRLLFEVDLGISRYGSPSIGAEDVTISAIFLDHMVHPRSVTILP